MFNTELARKVKFIEGINKTFTEFSKEFSISKIMYKVFRWTEDEEEHTQEFLVVVFKGGAVSVRNCNYDSFSAIFEEISHLIKGGYYSEVYYYNYCVENYKELDLTEEL